MIVNDVEIPKELLDIIKSDNLVVFVGAGVSMGAPTSLPNFYKLVESISNKTGRKFNKEVDSCERYLGRLKHDKIDVHKITSNKLSTDKLKHNALHEYIIDLFQTDEHIRIVTTNYDTMFEQVLVDRGIKSVNIYDAPALPLGNDFKGIIHIHGNVCDSTSMILTDEDFGKAYITDGFVSRFLVNLFESYHVLFIGYSYEDVIVKYLTRAISTNETKRRFILIEEDSRDFALLGIQSVCFGKGKYDVLYDIVNYLGEINHRSLLDWQSVINEYETEPPKDISLESEIEYDLHDSDKSFLLSKTIHGEQWFEWLQQRGVFNSIFDETAILNKDDKIWLDWFIQDFLGRDDDLIKRQIIKNNQINDYFVRKLLEELDNIKLNISDQNYREYIVMFYDKINDSLLLHRLIETTYSKGLYDVSLMLFKKMFDFNIECKEKFSLKNEIEYQCKFFMIDSFMDIVWEKSGNHLARIFPKEFVKFVKHKIESIYGHYKVIKVANDRYDPLNKYSFSLERKRYYSNLEEAMYLLCNGVCEQLLGLEKNDKNFAKNYILECLQSESKLLKNLALKLLRSSSLFSDDKKCRLLLKYIGVYSSGMKEQIFLLVARIFVGLSNPLKEKLFSEIDKGMQHINNTEDKHRIVAYGKFNWYVWLERNSVDTQQIKNRKNCIKQEYAYFEERKYPELDVYDPVVSWNFDKSPISEEEIKSMNIKGLIVYLRDFKEDGFNDVTQEGLYSTFCDCLTDNFEWGFDVVEQISKELGGEHPIWNKIISKISNYNYSVDQELDLIELIVKNVDIVKSNDLCLSRQIEEIISNNKIKTCFNELSERLFNLCHNIYIYGNKHITCDSNSVMRSLNCSVGVLVNSCVKLLSMEKEAYKEKKYYELFECLLSNEKSNLDQIIVVLCGNVQFFYAKNNEWCKKYILPYLTSKDDNVFAIAWEGIAGYSTSLNKNFAENNKEIYFDSMDRVNVLNENGREIFIRHYTLLMVYVIENPLITYIPKFYTYANDKDKMHYIKVIENCLNSQNINDKTFLWGNWLKEYWINRINNIPVSLSGKENKEMLSWCLELEDLYPESIQIIKQGVIFDEIDNLFLCDLENSELSDKYPDETADLLIYILNSGAAIELMDFWVRNLVEKLVIKDQKIKRELQEALIKRQIILDLK